VKKNFLIFFAEVIDPLSKNIVEANPSDDDVMKNVLEEESEEQEEVRNENT
jgi:hypothetical protein